MNREKEIRFVAARELRATSNADGTQTLSGYAAVFNSLSVDFGGWQEIIVPGAFTESLTLQPDVVCLRDHDSSILLGRTKSGTLTLAQDEVGLRFDCKLPKTTQAADLAELVSRGDVDACSFGFICRMDEWNVSTDGVAVRTVIKADLFDVSVVTYPAYPETSVSLRSAPREIRTAIESRAKKKTKRVDGEDLTADCFLIVGDPEKTDTWNLPWKFSTEEKTKSHLKDALARFDQVEGVDKDTLDKAWKKLLKLCADHGIDVSDEDKDKRSARASKRDMCDCPCEACLDGDCGDCDCDGCDSEGCLSESCMCASSQNRSYMHMQLEIAKRRAAR